MCCLFVPLFEECNGPYRRAVCIFPFQRQCEEPERFASAFVKIGQVLYVDYLVLCKQLFVPRQICVRYGVHAYNIEPNALFVRGKYKVYNLVVYAGIVAVVFRRVPARVPAEIKKQIVSLEKENTRLRRMLDMQNEIIETQKQELEVFERFMDKVEKAHEKAGSDRNAADAAESGTTEE